MFARSDRSRQHRALAATRGRALAKVSGSRLRSSRVRLELTNINLAGTRGAVASHEQLRSELTNKTSGGAIAFRDGESERSRVLRRVARSPLQQVPQAGQYETAANRRSPYQADAPIGRALYT
jgi:hypothetical protein